MPRIQLLYLVRSHRERGSLWNRKQIHILFLGIRDHQAIIWQQQPDEQGVLLARNRAGNLNDFGFFRIIDEGDLSGGTRTYLAEAGGSTGRWGEPLRGVVAVFEGVQYRDGATGQQQERQGAQGVPVSARRSLHKMGGLEGKKENQVELAGHAAVRVCAGNRTHDKSPCVTSEAGGDQAGGGAQAQLKEFATVVGGGFHQGLYR